MCACKCNISSTLKDLHKQHTISPHQRKLKQVSIHSLIKTASEHIKTICNKMEHYILLQELTGVVIGNKKSDSLEFAFFVVFFSNYHGWWKNLYITIIIQFSHCSKSKCNTTKAKGYCISHQWTSCPSSNAKENKHILIQKPCDWIVAIFKATLLFSYTINLD